MAEARRLRSRRAILLLALGGVGILVLVVALAIPLDQGGDEPLVVGGHPLFGEPAPEIELATLEGDRISLADLRGRPVLVNFWATWCLPCREEFPLMVEAYAEHADAGLEILGVIHDDTAEGARRFASDMGAGWPMLMDAQDVAWNDYLGAGVPTSFFIDAQGIVRAFSLGPFTESGLSAQLAKILPAAVPTDPAPAA